jgi:hypothetical protein
MSSVAIDLIPAKLVWVVFVADKIDRMVVYLNILLGACYFEMCVLFVAYTLTVYCGDSRWLHLCCKCVSTILHVVFYVSCLCVFVLLVLWQTLVTFFCLLSQNVDLLRVHNFLLHVWMLPQFVNMVPQKYVAMSIILIIDWVPRFAKLTVLFNLNVRSHLCPRTCGPGTTNSAFPQSTSWGYFLHVLYHMFFY